MPCFLIIAGITYYSTSKQRQSTKRTGETVLTNKKSGGKRKGTRAKFKRRTKKITIRKFLQEFEPGSKVHVKVDSGVHSGLPHSRFKGLTGIVLGKQGKKGVLVSVLHGNKAKTINVHAAHLALVKEKMAVGS
jgi:large subunit ribosomal protein L21e